MGHRSKVLNCGGSWHEAFKKWGKSFHTKHDASPAFPFSKITLDAVLLKGSGKPETCAAIHVLIRPTYKTASLIYMELTYRQQIDFQALVQEVQALKQMVGTLTSVVKRDKIFDAWLNEDDAASMLGLAPRTLRRYCRDGMLPINFRNTNGHNWQFSRKDMTAYMNNSSTMM
jgi:hypothetical protein